MSKILVIRKPDRTIHKVPLQNKATLMAFSNKLPDGQKWTFEEMDEKEAEKLPFIDPAFVSAANAQSKLKELEGQSAEKDAKIKELEAQLAAMKGGNNGAGDKTADKPEKAEAKIERINAAATAEEVAEILGDDARKSVMDAAAKKTASFS